MAEIDTAHLIYLIVLLAMVAGWFFMHSRPNMNKTLQQAAVWGLIFTGAAAGVGLWQDKPQNQVLQTDYRGRGVRHHCTIRWRKQIATNCY